MTWLILGVNIGIWVLGVATNRSATLIANWGLTPAHFSFVNLITSQFVHAGLFHLLGNMLFFWVFGDNVEDHLGRVWYLFLYLGSGAAGAIGHAVAAAGTPMAESPLVGASGALAGVMAAYLIFYPNQPIRILWFAVFYGGTFQVRAVWTIGIWAAQQLVMLGYFGAAGGVAYWAHVVGFATGLSLALADRYLRGVPVEILKPATRPGIPYAMPAGFAPEAPMARIPQGYSVIRASDDLTDISSLGSAVASVTGEPGSDVTRRLRRTRGVLARGLALDGARRLRASLPRIPTLIVDEGLSPPLAPPEAVGSAAAGRNGFDFDVSGGTVSIPWNRVAAVFAARIARRAPPKTEAEGGDFATRAMERTLEATFIDVVTAQPPRRFRLAQTRERFGTAVADASTPEMESFCRAVLLHRGSVPVNNGVAVAAGRGTWGYLSFPNESDYEDYAWWLFQIIRARSGAGASSFLE